MSAHRFLSRASRVVPLVCLGIIAASTWSAAQQARDTTLTAGPSVGTAVVSGAVVTDDMQARPVRRAIVTIAGVGVRGSRDTVTDDQGRFLFAGLPAGGYALSVSKAGWITTYLGSRRPGVPPYGGAPLTLAEAEHNTSLSLRLLHGSAITGTIRDHAGRPAGATVRLMEFQTSGGQRTLVPASAENTTDRADDRGVYRLYGIAPGEYVIALQVFANDGLHQITPDVLQAAQRAMTAGAAAPAESGSSTQGPTVGYAPVYFPGTVELAAAGIIKVGPDEEKSGVDFALQLVPTAEIDGVVVAPDGQPTARVQVQLLASGTASEASTVLSNFALLGGAFARIQADGTFKIPGVAPGQYTILARGADRSAVPTAGVQDSAGPLGRVGGAGAPTLWAAQEVSVNGRDIPGVTLTLQPGMTVSGHFTSDIAGVAPFDFTRVAVSLRYVDQPGVVTPMPVNADGTFSLSGVAPGHYRLNVVAAPNGRRGGGAASPVPEWKVASAVVAGHDALDRPFQVMPGEDVTGATIKLTSALAEISGTLTDASGRPAHDYVVVVFSADHAYWTTANRRMPRPTATPRDGTFRISNLPAGEYFVAVAADVDPASLRDPAFLEALSTQAMRVTLADGEKHVQDFKIGGGVLSGPFQNSGPSRR